MTSSRRVAAREHAGDPGRRPSSGAGEGWTVGGCGVAPAGSGTVGAEGIGPAAPAEESPGESRELPSIPTSVYTITFF